MAGLGDKISGAVRGVQGAGDMLRGGLTDAADQAGDAVTGRNDAAQKSSAHQDVASRGKEDLSEGIKRFQGDGQRTQQQTTNEARDREETARERAHQPSNAFTGAGEDLRQGLNSGIDSIGERIAGRKH